MDGVITDTEPLHQEADQWACETFGITVPDAEWHAFKGTTSKDTFACIIKNFTDGSVPVADLIRAKRVRYIEIARERMMLVPGAVDFIQYAGTRVPKMALVTSSSRGVLDLVFEKYKLRSYFNVTVTGNDITKGKPDPEPYLFALQKLCTSPVHTCVIEDSTNGIISAKAAGCKTIGITTSFPRDVLRAKGAPIVVDSFSEMYAILQ